ncbi:membrane protein [Vibrio inusitatus NBRC 102082]|uniref:Membrane protein n=1 Tax=Vibrio inusitatus NBRC 102082 TaxID=1219070 RepID=A0A4Y3HUY7_9VIBR|nr:HlyD family secretion protein [Vibrio inusitatus]GEA50795.1 membrane protein [Vibrio inusitatus NBRC 102082]
MKKYLVSIIILSLAIVLTKFAWDKYNYQPWTRDGKLKAEITKLSTDVDGKIVAIHVKDNQFVKKGDLLVTIDERDYLQAVLSAKAKVAQQKSELDIASNIATRDNKLSSGLISKEQVREENLNVEKQRAALQQSKADLGKSRLDLERTKIYAPTDGYITNLTQRVGNHLKSGDSIVALVEKDSFYVLGYFEETKLPDIHVGSKATVVLFSSGMSISGTVQSIGSAITDNSADDTGLIPQVSQTIPWIRLAQRVPVRVEFDELPQNVKLIHGTTASITINTID